MGINQIKNNKAKEIFELILKNNANPKIKLLGDSITHGVGGSGWEQNGDAIVDEFKESPNSYCWANLFRDYMKDKYGAIVRNKACTGTTVDFVMDNFSTLVESDDDIIVCTIGTNNRHKYFAEGEKPLKEDFLNEFYKKINRMHDMFKKNGIPFVLVANIPASKENEGDGEDYWRILHMSDINESYKRLSIEREAAVISLYDLFLEYCKKSDLTIDELLCDGLHPNDSGYKIMFDLLVKSFGV